MKNLLVGAVSTNYNISDVQLWIDTSRWEDCERVLFVYPAEGHTDTISEYLIKNSVQVIQPDFNFWGNSIDSFLSDTGKSNLQTSYDLIHNIRFLHMWTLLEQSSYEKVLITDVRDAYFNADPFKRLHLDKITATSEEIIYNSHQWNIHHLHQNLGLIGNTLLANKQVYNVGVFGGSAQLIKELCADIYLLSVGKPKVADQTSFNYLINTRYKNVTEFTGLKDKFAVHLHVINEGAVAFDLQTIPEYTIVHQYDRLKHV